MTVAVFFCSINYEINNADLVKYDTRVGISKSSIKTNLNLIQSNEYVFYFIFIIIIDSME